LHAEGTQYSIGVLTEKGPKATKQQWDPTARYLTKSIPGASFDVKPLSYEGLWQAIADEEIDFVLADPGVAVRFVEVFGIQPLAVMKRMYGREALPVLGSAVFVKKERTDLRRFRDLYRSRIAAVDRRSLGGWLAAAQEIKLAGLDIDKDIGSVDFAGSEEKVILEVAGGRADVGVVRTGVLESLKDDGGPRMRDFRVIRPAAGEDKQSVYSVMGDLPFERSTTLYPEWLFCHVNYLRPDLVQEIRRALHGVKPGDPEAIYGRYGGWSAPPDLSAVRACLEEFGLIRGGAVFGIDFRALLAGVSRHDWGEAEFSVLAGIAFLALLLVVFLRAMARLKGRLAESEAFIEKEMNRRRESERVLKETESKCSAMFGGAAEGIIITEVATGRIIYANSAAYRMLRFEADQMRDVSIGDVYPDESLDRLMERLMRVSQKNQSVSEAGVKLLRADRSEFEAQVSASQIVLGRRKCALIMMNDVTELKRVRKDLEEKELNLQKAEEDRQRTRKALEEAANKARQAQQSFEQSEQEREQVRQSLEEVKSQRRKQEEILMQKEEVLKDKEETLQKTEQSLQDTELMLKDAVKDLEDMKECLRRAEAATKTRGRSSRIRSDDFLITSAEPDVTEPPPTGGGVEGLSELSLKEALRFQAGAEETEETEEAWAEEEEISGERDVEDLIRLQGGHYTLSFSDFEIGRLIREAAAHAARKTDQNRVRLVCEISPEIPEVLNGDAVCFRRILRELLDNAFKFTEEGEVQISVEAEFASPGREPGQDSAYTLRIRIKDTGIGVPLDRQEAVFEVFTHASPEIMRDYGGVGSGLTIARSLAERMGGGLTIKSEEGLGSEFILTLPFGPATIGYMDSFAAETS